MSDESPAPKYTPVDKPKASGHPPRAARQRHKTAPETPFSRLAEILDTQKPKKGEGK